jgi:hypothetical protein
VYQKLHALVFLMRTASPDAVIRFVNGKLTGE